MACLWYTCELDMHRLDFEASAVTSDGCHRLTQCHAELPETRTCPVGEALEASTGFQNPIDMILFQKAPKLLCDRSGRPFRIANTGMAQEARLAQKCCANMHAVALPSEASLWITLNPWDILMHPWFLVEIEVSDAVCLGGRSSVLQGPTESELIAKTNLRLW